ncbi:MAG: hypothetical protein IIU82_04395 [Tidjanibacter sp.]|nr:hypothetical protein [Tidjanibacter sp.]
MAKTTTNNNPKPQSNPKPTVPVKEREVREYGNGGKINESAGPSGSPKK